MPSDLPLKTIFEIIEHLYHPLAYDFEAPVLQTLESFSVTCKAIHHFTKPILYSRVCIESVPELRRFAQLDADKLALVQSLYISLPHRALEEEVNRALGADLEDEIPFEFGSPLFFELHSEITDAVLYLLGSAGPKLERLVLECPESWGAGWRGPEEQEGAMHPRRFEQLSATISKLSLQLRELVLLRDFLAPEYPIKRQPYGALQRLALSGSYYFDVQSSHAPALEYLCLINSTVKFRSYNQALKRANCMRRVILVGEGTTMKRFGVEEVAEPAQWGTLPNQTVEGVIIKAPNNTDIEYTVGRLAKSGLLWEWEMT